jgi:hypothetical protein
MRTRLLAAAAAAVLLLPGCPEPAGRLKGRVVENGQPVGVPPQTALMFTKVGPDDKLDANKSYTANISPDGSFEVVASDGRLPPGKYAVSIESPGKGTGGVLKYKEKYKLPGSPFRVTVAAGQNELTVDLAQPPG